MSFLREYDIERDMHLLREEIFEKGFDVGSEDKQNKIAMEMIKNGEPLVKVSKYCGISEEETIKLVESLNVGE